MREGDQVVTKLLKQCVYDLTPAGVVRFLLLDTSRALASDYDLTPAANYVRNSYYLELDTCYFFAGAAALAKRDIVGGQTEVFGKDFGVGPQDERVGSGFGVEGKGVADFDERAVEPRAVQF